MLSLILGAPFVGVGATMAAVVGLVFAGDILLQPTRLWNAAGQSRAGWAALALLTLLPIANMVGLAASGWYVLRIRPRLRAAAED